MRTLRHPGAKRTQHAVRKYALAIIFIPAYILVSTEMNRIATCWRINISSSFHIFMALFFSACYLRQSPAQWFGNLTSALSFWNSPSCFLKLLRKHKLSFRRLYFPMIRGKVSAQSVCLLLPTTALSQKIDMRTQNCSDKFNSYTVLT
jgi:hypothetical protein